MPKGDVQKKLVDQVFNQIAKAYAQEQKDEAALLHNRFATVISELRPSHENLLLVLEILKQEVMGNLIDKMEQIKVKSQEIPPEEKTEEAKPHSGGGVG